MKKKNKEYEYIIKYIYTHLRELTEEEARFLLRYARSIKDREIEVNPNITKKSVLEDIKRLNERIKSGDQTPLSFIRLDKEIELFNSLISGEDIDEVSYELDKLYIDNDMDARERSSLIQRLEKKREEKHENKQQLR